MLNLAAGDFDVFVTIDQSLVHQQDLRRQQLAVVVIAAHINRFDAIEPLIPDVVNALESIAPGDVIRVGA